MASIPYSISWEQGMRDRSWRKIVWFGHRQCYYRSSGKRRHGAMVSTLACYPAPLWDLKEQRLGHHLKAALLAWAFSFLGRVQLTLAMAWLPGAIACAGNTDNEAGHPVMGDEGDRQVHKHMPVTVLRRTWRPSQEGWRPKWTDSLKLLGLMGYLLYLQTTKAWGTQLTIMKTM